MRFTYLMSIVLICCWSVEASHVNFKRRQDDQSLSTTRTRTRTASRSASATKTATASEKAISTAAATTVSSRTATRTASAAATSKTATPNNKKQKSGLTKAAKIGIGVGVPLGVLGLAGAILAYIIGKRKGRKRRVDDPTAGAGKKIRDPSAELNIPPATPAVPELPTVQSNKFPASNKSQKKGSQWWVPFGRSNTTKNSQYVEMPNNEAPRSPQEMPA